MENRLFKIVNIYKMPNDKEFLARNPKPEEGALIEENKLVSQHYIDNHINVKGGLMRCVVNEEATEQYYKDALAHKKELDAKEEAQKAGVNGLAEALIKGIKGDKEEKPKATRGRKPKEETKTEE